MAKVQTGEAGTVLLEFNSMMTNPAKTQAELVNLITEMDSKMKNVEDITGEKVGEMHAHSVLIGVLDHMTRQHTAMKHGLPYEFLKKIISEFANNSVLQSFSAPSTKIKHHD